MKHTILAGAIIFIASIVNGQIIHFDVTFPNSNSLSFKDEPPSLLISQGAKLQTRGSSSFHSLLTVHDSSGNVVMYCDGVDFFNNKMKRFDGLMPLQTIISPRIDPLDLTSSHWKIREIFELKPNHYVLFLLQSGFLVKREISISGDVINEIATPVLMDSLPHFDKITSVRLPKARVQWLITKSYDHFKAYPIQNGSIGAPVMSYFVERTKTSNYTSPGNMKLSRDGKTLISLEFATWPNSTEANIKAGGMVYQYDFDYASGIISNQVVRAKINYKDYVKNENDNEPYYSTEFVDVAFSPNDSIIFTITGSTRKDIPAIWQIKRYDSASSPYTISTYRDSTENYFLSSIFQAPNGKLYVMHNAFEYSIGGGWQITNNRIGTIQKPNIFGKDCGVHLNSYILDDYSYLRNVHTSYLPRTRFKVVLGCNGQSWLANLSDDGFIRYEWYHDSVLIATTTDVSDSFRILDNPGHHYYRIRGITSEGLSIWYSDTVKLTSKLIVNAELKTDIICQWKEFGVVKSKFCFSTQSKSGISAYWTFGDGSSSNSIFPKHIYKDTGIYHIKGWLSNGYDTVYMSFDSIKVVNAPKPDVILNDTIFCSPAHVTIIDSFFQIKKRTYKWSDGFESNQPKHSRILDKGNYFVVQIIEGFTGCKSIDTFEIEVKQGIKQTDTIFLNSTKVESSMVRIEFTPRVGIDKYSVFRFNENQIIERKLKEFEISRNSFLFNNLSTTDTVYNFYLRGFDDCGTSTSYLDTIHSIVLNAKWQSNDVLQLIWNSSKSNYTSEFILQMSTDRLIWSDIHTSKGLNFHHLDVDQIDAKIVYFKVLQKFGKRRDTSISNIIEIDIEFKMFVPNAFTPNNDKINDRWELDFFGINEFECKIYSQTGQIMAIINEKEPFWDGLRLAEKCEMGNYYYIIEAVDEKGQKIIQSGILTLIR